MGKKWLQCKKEAFVSFLCTPTLHGLKQYMKIPIKYKKNKEKLLSDKFVNPVSCGNNSNRVWGLFA